ncbi:MAG: nicotinamide mononucleotide deamidase-related protein [Acidilobus sp.]
MALPQGPKAWLLTIGNELLIGRVVNTNAAWLARRLTFLGFNVERIIVTPDEPAEVAEEIRRALSRGDVKVIVTTGGLGPTYDDRTLEAVALATERRLTLNQVALEWVRQKYESGNMPMTKEREKMAYMPEGAEPIRNPVGTAPGSLLKVKDTVIISLPGVPAEMQAMFEEVMDRLKEMAPRLSIADCGFIVVGVPESELAPFIEEAERRNPGCYVKSHPKGHEIRGPILEVRVLASAPTKDEATQRAMRALEMVREGARSRGGEITEEGCQE